MALNWSRNKARQAASKSARLEAEDNARFARAAWPVEREPTKAELRAEANTLIARYRGRTRQLPTWIKLKCWKCNHRGTAKVKPGARARFKCSKCGATSV